MCFVNPLLVHVFGAEALAKYIFTGSKLCLFAESKRVPPLTWSSVEKKEPWTSLDRHALEPEFQVRLTPIQVVISMVEIESLSLGHPPRSEQDMDVGAKMLAGA